MDKKRLLLALRTIDVSYRAALDHAPEGPDRHEWLAKAHQSAEQLLNRLESRFLASRDTDPETRLQFRIVRENTRPSRVAR